MSEIVAALPDSTFPRTEKRCRRKMESGPLFLHYDIVSYLSVHWAQGHVAD